MSTNSSSSNGNNMNKGSRQTKRPAPLKMVKEEVRQYRPPVITYTYSPKIIHVDPAQFSSLVQSLTGRGHKRKPEASPRVIEPKMDEFNCASPSSSNDSGIATALEGPHGLLSPRGPLGPFQHIYQSAGFESSCAAQQAAAEKASSMFSNTVLAAAKATAATGGAQYSPLFSAAFPSSLPYLFSPLPSPNLLSPNFIADLPVLSPSTYQGFDPFAHAFVSSPGYGKFSGAGMMPSPGSSNAYKDMALMLSRE
ncbi:unnamed protein product [Calypogeia fissa]